MEIPRELLEKLTESFTDKGFNIKADWTITDRGLDRLKERPTNRRLGNYYSQFWIDYLSLLAEGRSSAYAWNSWTNTLIERALNDPSTKQMSYQDIKILEKQLKRAKGMFEEMVQRRYIEFSSPEEVDILSNFKMDELA